jgi:hypothetical protein
VVTETPFRAGARLTVAVDNDMLMRQLAILRLLCSQIGFALDTALVSLHELGDALPNDGSRP